MIILVIGDIEIVLCLHCKSCHFDWHDNYGDDDIQEGQ